MFYVTIIAKMDARMKILVMIAIVVIEKEQRGALVSKEELRNKVIAVIKEEFLKVEIYLVMIYVYAMLIE